MFHGCVHDASGSWPYDPVSCPDCLGLPEEVAHTKQALAHGFAVLALESKSRERDNRYFSYSNDPVISDRFQAPLIIQVGLVGRWLGREGTPAPAGCGAYSAAPVRSTCQPTLWRCRPVLPACAVQSFVLEMGLAYLPVYTLGISAGASFAAKIPRAFYHREHQ